MVYVGDFKWIVKRGSCSNYRVDGLVTTTINNNNKNTNNNTNTNNNNNISTKIKI